MWIADMDFESPQPVIDAIVERARHGVYGYVTRPESYYAPLIDWLSRRQRWAVKPEWITHCPGVVVGLSLAVQTFTRPGDKVIIQPPVYPPFFTVPKNIGRQLVFNPLKIERGHYRMDLENLERQIDPRTKLLILCSPHNPVGRVWSRDELSALGEMCVRKNVLILSDEIHSDLILPGHSHTPLATLSEEIAQNTLTFVAPSKTFNLAGLFTSAVIIPNARRRAEFNTALENNVLNSLTVFGTVAFQAAYLHGEEWLTQLLDYLQGTVDFALEFFAERIPRIKVLRPEGTYLLWLDCRDLGLDQTALKALMLKQAKVALNDGLLFGANGAGFMRMNIGCPCAMAEEGLARIERAVNNL